MDCPACHHPNVDGARFCAKCGALLPSHAPEAADPLIGQILGGRFRITQLLGEGGMGRVYVAEQQMGTSIRKVAVKTLLSQYANDPQLVARFHRECGTVSELDHPNTIHFFDFGQTPSGELYIAMEYVQGKSLAEVMAPGPLPLARVLHIMSQVCGSLEEAHAHGVIHRDLKPDNIILTHRAGQDDFVKVLDFGIAKRDDSRDAVQEQKLTQQGTVLGTPPYMSPEQFTGRELDARSDIYSLGVMTYEMLTGRLPFDANTPWEWATQHMTAQPFPFEQSVAGAKLPVSAKGAILRALAKNREDRPATVRAFYDDLASQSSPLAIAATALVPAVGHSGTAMMTPIEASAALQPGVASTVAGSAYTPAFSAAVVHSSPVPASPAYVAAVPVAASSKNGGKKGLILGLSGTAGVLLIAGVIVGARSLKPQEDPPPVLSKIAPPTQPVALTQPPPLPVADPLPVAIPGPPDRAGERPLGKPKNPKEIKDVKDAAPAVSGPKSEGACTEARRLAELDDVAAAARAFAGCDTSTASAEAARAAISRKAPLAVERKIFNGDCAGARGIVAATTSVGAAGSAAAALAKAPQCNKK